MPDGLLLIALAVADEGQARAAREALEAAGVRLAEVAIRQPGAVTALDHDRLADYFGEGWTNRLGLGSVELVSPAWTRPDLHAVPTDTSAQEDHRGA